MGMEKLESEISTRITAKVEAESEKKISASLEA